MTDVVELQRQHIKLLEQRMTELTNDLVKQIEINGNLSQVLAYLTDNRFKQYASHDNWNRVICEFLVSEDHEHPIGQ